MKQKEYKHYHLYKPNTHYVCRQCNQDTPVSGATWIFKRRPTPSVDGKNAWRIYWFCINGHKTFRGYTRPVDHGKNIGGNSVFDDGVSFEDEENEMEMEYKEMMEYAARCAQATKKYF